MGSIGPQNFGGNLKQQLMQILSQPLTADSLASIQQQLAQAPGGLRPGDALLATTLLLSQLMAVRKELSPQEMGLFMKNILQMPQDMQALLAMLATKPGDAKADVLKKLLEDNPQLKIPLEEIQELLAGQSKEGSQKLFKLMQSSQLAFTGNSAMTGDVIKHLSQISLQANNNPVEALKTLVLLYLPWYPLAPQQDLQLYFEMGEGDEGGEGEDARMILYIETNALGKFRIAVHVKNRTQLQFEIQHEEIAREHLPTIQKTLVDALLEDNLPEPVFTWDNTFPAPPPSSVSSKRSGGQEFKAHREESKKIAVYPPKGVSIVVLNGAYRLARIIFEIDERTGLLFKRKKDSEK